MKDLYFIEVFDPVPAYHFHIKLGKYSRNDFFPKIKTNASKNSILNICLTFCEIGRPFEVWEGEKSNLLSVHSAISLTTLMIYWKNHHWHGSIIFIDLGIVRGSAEDMIKIHSEPKKTGMISKCCVMSSIEKKKKNAVLNAVLNVVFRCDRVFFRERAEQRKCDHKLKESQPDAQSTQAKSHAFKKRGNLIVNVLAYH